MTQMIRLITSEGIRPCNICLINEFIVIRVRKQKKKFHIRRENIKLHRSILLYKRQTPLEERKCTNDFIQNCKSTVTALTPEKLIFHHLRFEYGPVVELQHNHRTVMELARSQEKQVKSQQSLSQRQAQMSPLDPTNPIPSSSQRQPSLLPFALWGMALGLIISFFLFWSRGSEVPTISTETKQLPNGIPKILWIYSDSPKINSNFDGPMSQNHRYFAQKSGFEIRTISEDNYLSYLPEQKAAALSQKIQSFSIIAKSHAKDEHNYNLIHRRLKPLLRKIIALHVLQSNGGVIIQQSLLLIEDLSWISEVDTNPYVNRLNRTFPTQVVAFFDSKASMERKRYPTDQPEHAPWKLVRPRLAMHPALIAAKKQAPFISELCREFQKQLIEREYLIDKMKKHQPSEGRVVSNLAKRVLERHQDRSKNTGQLAIDSLGLSFINFNHGPLKFIRQHISYNETNRFNFTADLPIEQLYQIFGPCRYALYLQNKESYLQKEITRVLKGQRKIMNGSLLHSLFPHVKTIQTYQNEEVSVTNQRAPQWKKLPKIVWMVWTSNFEKASAAHRLSYAMMLKSLERIGWKLNLVTLDNAMDYLGDVEFLEIKRIAEDKQHLRYPHTMPDLLRLALLARHGGVYMDVTVFTTRGIDWLVDIARLPSHLITNKFTELPKVVMFYSPYIKNPPFWNISSKTKTKESMIQWYENSFIAAQKGSQLILEVYSYYKQLLMSPWQKIKNLLKESGMMYYRKADPDNIYLLQMQLFLCVLGLKQKELNLRNPSNKMTATEQYGMWSVYGFYGPVKFWVNNHLDDQGIEPSSYYMDVPSELVDGLVGRMEIPFFKLVGEQSKGMTRWFNSHSQQNKVVSDQFHLRSHMGKMIST